MEVFHLESGTFGTPGTKWNTSAGVLWTAIVKNNSLKLIVETQNLASLRHFIPQKKRLLFTGDASIIVD